MRTLRECHIFSVWLEVLLIHLSWDQAGACICLCEIMWMCVTEPGKKPQKSKPVLGGGAQKRPIDLECVIDIPSRCY